MVLGECGERIAVGICYLQIGSAKVKREERAVIFEVE
jgi:hypothetical protein